MPNALTRRVVTSMYDLAVQLREDCSAGGFMESISTSMWDMHAFAGFAELCEMEERYLPADELAAKYEGASHGWRQEHREGSRVNSSRQRDQSHAEDLQPLDSRSQVRGHPCGLVLVTDHSRPC